MRLNQTIVSYSTVVITVLNVRRCGESRHALLTHCGCQRALSDAKLQDQHFAVNDPDNTKHRV